MAVGGPKMKRALDLVGTGLEGVWLRVAGRVGREPRPESVKEMDKR